MARGFDKMNTIRKEDEERVRDISVIEGLAKSQGVHLEEVRRLYESALTKMKQDAVIFDFLPIFAARYVREVLEKRNHSDPFDDPETDDR